MQVVALEPLDDPGRIVLVANTHLYFHPNAAHVRMIQVLVAVRYIESLLQHFKKQVISGHVNNQYSKYIGVGLLVGLLVLTFSR